MPSSNGSWWRCALVFTAAVALLGTGAALPEAVADEALRVRAEALVLEPRIDEFAVADPELLIRFYERRQFSPAWQNEAKLAELIGALQGSPRHGLDPTDYHLDRLQAHLVSLADGGGAVEFDLLATDALARYAFHLHFGKVNPEAIEPTWNFDRSFEGKNPLTALETLVDAPDLAQALDALAPQGERYLALQQALADLRRVAAAGGWPRVPDGETLRIGMESPRVAALRARLQAVGLLPAPGVEARAETGSPVFDAALADAVRRFQSLHGLASDGVVGARTIAALNTPVEARIDQLRVNLERVRWIFRDLEARYIIANIARFRVTLIENGATVWTTRAVVGQPYRQTPVFRGVMTYLVLNPTWTVPPGILAQDLLPEVRRDRTALDRRRLSIIDTTGREIAPDAVDWEAASFPYMLRQAPGPENALGRVKFIFPNPYHVYMHDTPARDLFDRTDRTFSSGCIRLEHPLELARLLLGEAGWDDAALDAALATGQPRTVTLPRPLSVLMIYATAVPEDGEVLFLPDIYSRDARLLAALDAAFEFVPPSGYSEALSAGAP